MGFMKALVLWSEEVMDEVYPSLSEADRAFLSRHQEELDAVMGDCFRKGLTVEEGAKEVYVALRDLQYDHHWARSA